MTERYSISREEGKRICLEKETMCVPRYATSHTSIVATGKKGRAPGELHFPVGVAIHENTHQIFIVNHYNDRVEIFSETGEYFCQLGVGQLYRPHGIATYRDSIYVSCFDHTVSKFSMSEMYHVRKIGGRGSNNGQFNFPTQLTNDLVGRVFKADFYNDRICIHDPNLNHLRNITHKSMSYPWDVKILRDSMYVMCTIVNDPCMHVLTLEGDMLHSITNFEEWMDVRSTYCSVWILSTTLLLVISCLTQFVSSLQKAISYTR